jgi:hypothetical protein
MSELRQCISKSPCRLTVASCEDHDSLITDICVKITNRTNTKHTEFSCFISDCNFVFLSRSSVSWVFKFISSMSFESILHFKFLISASYFAIIYSFLASIVFPLSTKLCMFRVGIKIQSYSLKWNWGLTNCELMELEDVNKETIVQKETTSRILNRL